MTDNDNNKPAEKPPAEIHHIRAMLDAEAALADADPNYPSCYTVGEPLTDDEEDANA